MLGIKSGDILLLSPTATPVYLAEDRVSRSQLLDAWNRPAGYGGNFVYNDRHKLCGVVLEDGPSETVFNQHFGYWVCYKVWSPWISSEFGTRPSPHHIYWVWVEEKDLITYEVE